MRGDEVVDGWTNDEVQALLWRTLFRVQRKGLKVPWFFCLKGCDSSAVRSQIIDVEKEILDYGGLSSNISLPVVSSF